MTDYIALGALTATSVLGAQEAQGGAMSEKAMYGTLCVPATSTPRPFVALAKK